MPSDILKSSDIQETNKSRNSHSTDDGHNQSFSQVTRSLIRKPIRFNPRSSFLNSCNITLYSESSLQHGITNINKNSDNTSECKSPYFDRNKHTKSEPESVYSDIENIELPKFSKPKDIPIGISCRNEETKKSSCSMSSDKNFKSLPFLGSDKTPNNINTTESGIFEKLNTFYQKLNGSDTNEIKPLIPGLFKETKNSIGGKKHFVSNSSLNDIENHASSSSNDEYKAIKLPRKINIREYRFKNSKLHLSQKCQDNFVPSLDDKEGYGNVSSSSDCELRQSSVTLKSSELNSLYQKQDENNEQNDKFSNIYIDTSMNSTVKLSLDSKNFNERLKLNDNFLNLYQHQERMVPDRSDPPSNFSSSDEVFLVSDDDEDENQPDTNILDSGPISGGGNNSLDSDNESVMDNCIFLENCTSLIGSYHIKCHWIKISLNCITMKVPQLIEGGAYVLILKSRGLLRIACHLSEELNVLFLYLKPSTASYVRTNIKMPGVKNSEYPFFDPLSKIEFEKRIVIFLTEIKECEKASIQAYLTGSSILKMLSIEDAKTVLTKSYPDTSILEKMKSSSLPKSVTLFLYPPDSNRGAITVSTDDYRCLEEGQYLNDVIIDFYLLWLLINKVPSVEREKTHIFSTFFYKRLTSKNKRKGKNDENRISNPEDRHARVKSWTKNVDLFSKDFIIIPINVHSHWFLVVVCFPGLVGPIISRKIPHSAKPSLLKTASDILNEAFLCQTSSLVTLAESDRDEADGEEDDLASCLSEESVDPEASSAARLNESSCLPPSNSNKKLKMNPSLEAKNTRQPCILIFDSLRGCNPRSPVAATIREYLDVEFKRKTGRTDVKFTPETIPGTCLKVPQQQNLTDCGLYTLQYAENFFSRPLKRFNFPCPSLRNWFNDNVINAKREAIADLIKNITKDSNPSALNSIPCLIFNSHATTVYTDTDALYSGDSSEVMLKSTAMEDYLNSSFSSDENHGKNFKNFKIVKNQKEFQPSTLSKETSSCVSDIGPNTSKYFSSFSSRFTIDKNQAELPTSSSSEPKENSSVHDFLDDFPNASEYSRHSSITGEKLNKNYKNSMSKYVKNQKEFTSSNKLTETNSDDDMFTSEIQPASSSGSAGDSLTNLFGKSVGVVKNVCTNIADQVKIVSGAFFGQSPPSHAEDIQDKSITSRSCESSNEGFSGSVASSVFMHTNKKKCTSDQGFSSSSSDESLEQEDNLVSRKRSRSTSSSDDSPKIVSTNMRKNIAKNVFSNKSYKATAEGSSSSHSRFNSSNKISNNNQNRHKNLSRTREVKSNFHKKQQVGDKKDVEFNKNLKHSGSNNPIPEKSTLAMSCFRKSSSLAKISQIETNFSTTREQSHNHANSSTSFQQLISGRDHSSRSQGRPQGPPQRNNEGSSHKLFKKKKTFHKDLQYVTRR